MGRGLALCGLFRHQLGSAPRGPERPGAAAGAGRPVRGDPRTRRDRAALRPAGGQLQRLVLRAPLSDLAALLCRSILERGGEPSGAPRRRFRGAAAARRRPRRAERGGGTETPARRAAHREPAVAGAIEAALHAFRRRARATRRASAACTSCSKCRPTGSPIGASPQRRSITGGSSTSTSWPGLRMELPELFEATHRLVFALIERGDVQGLRIDHIDGLFDPAGLLRRAARAARRRALRRRRENTGALRNSAGLADRRQHRLRFRQPGAGDLCRSGRRSAR